MTLDHAFGLTAVGRALADPESPAYALNALGNGPLRRLVVIAVNARSETRNELDQSDASTSIAEMVEAVTSVPIDSTTANVALAFRGFVTSLVNDRNTLRQLGLPAEFKIYPVEIDFDELPSTTKEQIEERDNVKSIATTWTISEGEVSLIDKVAGQLLWRHPCFRSLLTELNASGSSEAEPPPGIQCPQQ